MILILSLISAFFCVFSANAATPREVLKDLHGCFQVSYRFVESGDHELDLHGELYEWVDFAEAGGKLIFQHYGIANGESQKHWREEWTDAGSGLWTQRVIGPFEDFRYECTAPFAFNQWRCTTFNSPKPLRDHGRKDYDVLDRENTLQISAKTWVQSERNTKHLKNGTQVSNEVGWNEYRRVDDRNCAPAIQPSP